MEALYEWVLAVDAIDATQDIVLPAQPMALATSDSGQSKLPSKPDVDFHFNPQPGSHPPRQSECRDLSLGRHD